MRGIAAARAQQARAQLTAVDRYEASIANAIARAPSLLPPGRHASAHNPARLSLVLFCAEQGFAGAFSQRVLDAAGADLARSELFVAGTRGRRRLLGRIKPSWSGAMPSHSLGIPKLAATIATALYARLATGDVGRLEAIFCRWEPGEGLQTTRQVLFPLDLKSPSRDDQCRSAVSQPSTRGAAGSAHSGLSARRAVPCCTARFRSRERSTDGGHGGRAHPKRGSARRATSDATPHEKGRNHRRDHRTGCRRGGE